MTTRNWSSPNRARTHRRRTRKSSLEVNLVLLFALLLAVEWIGHHVAAVLIIGVLAGMGIIFSLWVRRRRLFLYKLEGVHWTRRELLRISPLDFEHLVAELYRRQGYQVHVNHRIAPDGGIDITLTRQNERRFVQCKRWSSAGGVSEVRELLGVVTAYRGDGGILVCTSGFTRAAREWAAPLP